MVMRMIMKQSARPLGPECACSVEPVPACSRGDGTGLPKASGDGLAGLASLAGGLEAGPAVASLVEDSTKDSKAAA